MNSTGKVKSKQNFSFAHLILSLVHLEYFPVLRIVRLKLLLWGFWEFKLK